MIVTDGEVEHIESETRASFPAEAPQSAGWGRGGRGGGGGRAARGARGRGGGRRDRVDYSHLSGFGSNQPEGYAQNHHFPPPDFAPASVYRVPSYEPAESPAASSASTRFDGGSARGTEMSPAGSGTSTPASSGWGGKATSASSGWGGKSPSATFKGWGGGSGMATWTGAGGFSTPSSATSSKRPATRDSGRDAGGKRQQVGQLPTSLAMGGSAHQPLSGPGNIHRQAGKMTPSLTQVAEGAALGSGGGNQLPPPLAVPPAAALQTDPLAGDGELSKAIRALQAQTADQGATLSNIVQRQTADSASLAVQGDSLAKLTRQLLEWKPVMHQFALDAPGGAGVPSRPQLTGTLAQATEAAAITAAQSAGLLPDVLASPVQPPRATISDNLDDLTAGATSAMPMVTDEGPASTFWTAREYSIDEVIDLCGVDPVASATVEKGSWWLYHKVVEDGQALLIPFPLLTTPGCPFPTWAPMLSFVDTFAHHPNYVSVLLAPYTPLFQGKFAGWKVIIDLIESGEAAACYDPSTTGSWLERTGTNKGAFFSKSPAGAPSPAKRTKTGNDGSAWGGNPNRSAQALP
jgi:hypothetical protein